MNRAQVAAMQKAGNIDGLIEALHDPEDYIRGAAADALGGFADRRVAEALETVKFCDPALRVKRAASYAHARVVERIRTREEQS
ncbi:MAG: HEAT repeat domain-containing protein [Methanomicrobiaceae archaeon]|nr:HEAT repeat domain-containing protein [Methanomicrobiaceae archaeon]